MTAETVSTANHQHVRGYIAGGLISVVAAAAAVTLVAAALGAAGVDFELPDGGATVPLLGFTQLTVIFSVIGLAIAAALNRWTKRPATTFVRVAVTLTAVSIVPPFTVGANIATALSLVVLHLVAAGIVIPVVARRLPN